MLTHLFIFFVTEKKIVGPTQVSWTDLNSEKTKVLFAIPEFSPQPYYPFV